MASGPITLWQIDEEKMEAVSFHFLFSWAPNILFSWAPKSMQMVNAALKLKDDYSLEGKL